MKRKLICAVLLLCIALSATACTFGGEDIPVWTSGNSSSDGQTTAPSDTTQTPSEPSDPALLIGKWYSASSATVMQFFSNNTVKVFNLTPGYYEYASVQDGSFTYDGLTLTYTLEDNSKLDAACSVTAEKMTVATSAGRQLQFVPTDTLPEKHPEYSFPDFETLAKSHLLPDGSFTGNSLPTNVTDMRKLALENISAQFRDGKKDDSMVALTEGTAKIGDFVSINYTGYLDGEPFTGGSATDAQIQVAPDTGYIPGFAEGVAGHQVGETFDVDVTFPENYNPSLAGKAVVFRMTLNCIYNVDEWAEKEYNELLKDEVWKLLPDLANAEVPEEAYLFFLQINLDQLHYMAFYYGYDYEAFLTMAQITEEQLREDCIRIARIYLQAEQLAQKFDLTPDEELTNRITEDYIAELIANQLTREEAEDYIKNDGKFEFRALLITDLVSSYLVENNTFVDAPAEQLT